MTEEVSVLYRLVRMFAHLVLTLNGAGRRGQEHIPAEGPCIIVCNHLSYVDPGVVGWAAGHRQVYFMAKREAFRSNFGRRFLTGLGSFPVDRGRPDRKALDHALGLLQQGRVVGLFPEGTRSVDCALRPFHLGVAALAERSRAPVVPAALTNTRHLYEERRGLNLPPIQIRFGRPLAFEGEGKVDRAALALFRQQLEEQVAALLRECEEASHGVCS